jgi:hypothetical protein
MGAACWHNIFAYFIAPATDHATAWAALCPLYFRSTLEPWRRDKARCHGSFFGVGESCGSTSIPAKRFLAEGEFDLP